MPIRVDEHNPCKICGKTDWCSISDCGKYVYCPRTQEGSIGEYGEWGYIHPLNKGIQVKPKPKKKIVRDWGKLQHRFRSPYLGNVVCELADKWGVSGVILDNLDVGWDGKAYTFPIRNYKGEIIGIQRRYSSGEKRMVSGSKVGLFIPNVITYQGLPIPTETSLGSWTLFITEGISDLAVALDMGLDAIGRLSAKSGLEEIALWCSKQNFIEKIVIVADNDKVGIDGAKKLGMKILHIHKLFGRSCPEIQIIIPPDGIKDLREWKEKELIKEKLLEIVDV